MTSTPNSSAARPERCPACGRKRTRGNPANARYWALLHRIAERLRPQGQTFSADQWHIYAKSRWIGCDDVVLPNGKVIPIPRSSARLDVAEFGTYMEQVEAWAAAHDVYLDGMEGME